MNHIEHIHDAGTACLTCDSADVGQPQAGPRLSTVRLTARGEEFRIVQLRGQLLVCARQHGSCCCGWNEKGRMPFDPQELWGEEWEKRKIRNRVHLTFTGCLGPCAVGNSALVLLYDQAIWLKDLKDPDLARAVYDWIETMLAANGIVSPPDRLADHVYQRFLEPSETGCAPFILPATYVTDGLEHIDPVCLMEVDPASAKHTVEYAGRTVVFCAPSCKRQFLDDPSAYLTA